MFFLQALEDLSASRLTDASLTFVCTNVDVRPEGHFRARDITSKQLQDDLCNQNNTGLQSVLFSRSMRHWRDCPWCATKHLIVSQALTAAGSRKQQLTLPLVQPRGCPKDKPVQRKKIHSVTKPQCLISCFEFQCLRLVLLRRHLLQGPKWWIYNRRTQCSGTTWATAKYTAGPQSSVAATAAYFSNDAWQLPTFTGKH